MQGVGPAGHPPATAEHTPNFAPVPASPWFLTRAEGTRRSSSQEGELEEDRDPG